MFLLVDKPKRITSHDVVDEVRKVTGESRVGHAGTLDPNATGLLVIGVGREFTKKLGEIAKNTKKTYLAEIFLGEERDTDDSEGSLRDDKPGVKSLPALLKVKEVLSSFIGKQKQVPPKYSAIKIKGKKAYELARKNKVFELEPRKIIIYSIKLLGYNYPFLNIECEVSSGTYIRSLSRDIGRKLGSGAYLKNLRRTRIGKFSLERAVNLKDLTKGNWESFGVELDN